MKLKDYKEKYSKKAIKKPIVNRKYVDYKWVSVITILAFIISFIFSFISEVTIPNANMIVAILIIIVFIGLGIIFDMIGIAVTVADINDVSASLPDGVRCICGEGYMSTLDDYDLIIKADSGKNQFEKRMFEIVQTSVFILWKYGNLYMSYSASCSRHCRGETLYSARKALVK